MISKIKNLILLLGAIIIVIVAAEITLNIIGNASSSRMNPVANLSTNSGALHWRPDPLLHHVLVPGAKFSRTSPDKKEFITSVEYNSKGLNDYEYDYKKNEDTVRILVFGDSFVEASEVKKEENFCKIIEKTLNAGDSGKSFEVINMGVFGYSPILEYIYLKNEGLKYNPDMVIVCFFVNDVYEDL
ncbi:MAG: SGNH/GDSL hydrolase family protein, partial [Candidatus Omnitrophica bacterium]|nr:SGNH/GDSL hydrolase family protein [Candidatus Omnitrophota bacterium]